MKDALAVKKLSFGFVTIFISWLFRPCSIFQAMLDCHTIRAFFFPQGTAKDMSKKLTFSHMRKSLTRCKEDLKEKQKEQKNQQIDTKNMKFSTYEMHTSFRRYIINMQ